MTTVRIAHADPWPGREPDGPRVLLADDGGHRVLPVRLGARDSLFWRLLARQEDRGEEHQEDHAKMTGRLLHAAGITVTAVTVTDLGPGVTAARIDITAPTGPRQLTTHLADGFALAVITGAPLVVEDPLMDRLAEPVTGPDQPGLLRSGEQATPGPPRQTRFEPRNMTFADGLHRWRLDGTFLRQPAGFHDRDYSCTTEGGRVIVAAAVPEPAGFAFLSQEINADDYRGRTVTFGGDLRSADVADRAGLALRVIREGPPTPRGPAGRDPWHDPANHFAPVTGTRDWTRQEITTQIPPDASTVIFGVFLNGSGRIELRDLDFAAQQANR